MYFCIKIYNQLLIKRFFCIAVSQKNSNPSQNKRIFLFHLRDSFEISRSSRCHIADSNDYVDVLIFKKNHCCSYLQKTSCCRAVALESSLEDFTKTIINIMRGNNNTKVFIKSTMKTRQIEATHALVSRKLAQTRLKNRALGPPCLAAGACCAFNPGSIPG